MRRRLSPWTAVVGTARELAALVVAGVIGLIVGGLSAGLYFTLAGVLAGLAHNALSWATFTYTLYDDRIELRRTFIGRWAKIIPLDRIRGVDITTRLPHRLFGVAVVHIDAAAGALREDGVLDAVSRAEAERLRRVLVARAPQPVAAEVVYARARPRWYLYAPLSGAYLLTPFAVIGSVVGSLYNVGDDFGLITEHRLRRLTMDLAGAPRWTALAIAAVLVVAMPIASVVAFSLVNWDFTLRAASSRAAIVAERGLFTRRSVSLERARIRGVELRDNPVERLAGVVRLDALITGLGRAEHRGRLLPAVPTALAYDVAGRILGAQAPGPLTGHPATARARRVVRAMAPFFGAAALAWLAGRTALAIGCLALSVLGVPLGLDRYRQLGHATGNGRLSVRSGSLRRHQAIVEYEAVVGWRMKQTLFQRRLGLATLTVAVGAGHGGYPAIDIAETDAVALARDITPDWIKPFLDA